MQFVAFLVGNFEIIADPRGVVRTKTERFLCTLYPFSPNGNRACCLLLCGNVYP